jgi:Mlc titration factor MtfA (ptsG expression regulator)
MLKGLLERLVGGPVAIPDMLWESTLASVPFLARLSGDDRVRLRTLAERFLAEKQMGGAAGLELTAEMQVHIAAQACLPILNLDLGWYRGWNSIVVYPDEFLVARSVMDDAGVVHEYTEPISGEAWDGGPVLISWEDAQKSSTDDGTAYSVVIHEFTHKIDLLNGDADGVPPFAPALHRGLDIRNWQATLADAYETFIAEIELVESELPSTIDPESREADSYYAHLPLDAYAAQDAGEFFAVSSEAFFVKPARLHAAFPAWYTLLAAFFRQDPLAQP